MKNARLWISIYTELSVSNFTTLSREELDGLKRLSQILKRRERTEIDNWLQSRPAVYLTLLDNGLILHRKVEH
jgi:hypothetical protein